MNNGSIIVKAKAIFACMDNGSSIVKARAVFACFAYWQYFSRSVGI